MHDFLHLLGFCADAHFHYDLFDFLAYMGLSEISLQFYWIKIKLKELIGK